MVPTGESQPRRQSTIRQLANPVLQSRVVTVVITPIARRGADEGRRGLLGCYRSGGTTTIAERQTLDIERLLQGPQAFDR